MCGIAGYQGRFGATLIERMNTVQAHRGPDGAGSAAWRTDETVTALGHRRLAIIDLSPAGAQPMGLECPCCGSAGLDDLALTFNGEIYNYRELRQELESRGHRFSTETDSEVLLHLYGESGTALLERLNGMFAFAIRDGRPAGRPAGIEPGDVLIARDQFGVKPLYYAETGAGTVFASELKAVLQADEVERALDPMAVQLHLAYLWCPAPRTILRSVRKLEPGAAMVLRQGRVERHWFWYDLPYDGHYDTRPAAAIEEELRERLATAVRRQLVADVPVGAFLSGGVDSTAIVAMMRRAGATPQCFGIGFGSHYRGEENPDDLPYARIAARRLGVPLTEIVIGPEVVGQLERMLYFLDEPQADLAPVNAMLFGARAREAGIPVLLSGCGGDDILAGYRRHGAVRTG
ncbi:MAG: asparagine synthase (glutamine-hydrolyzing), partial [Gemmatimonadales bacterium]